MNAAIQNTLQQYLEVFMDNIAERFDINRDELSDIWKETQKKKFSKNKRIKRKKTTVPSAYILFCKDERPKIKDLTFAEVAKELGRRWNQTPADVKDRYQKQRDILFQLVKENTVEEEGVVVNENISVGTVTDDDEGEVIQEEPAQEEEKPKKSKKPKKPKELEIPEEITNERERHLWIEFAQLTITELRTQCDHNNIKKSKNRNDMIHSLVVHRIALEDGNTQIDSDNEE